MAPVQLSYKTVKVLVGWFWKWLSSFLSIYSKRLPEKKEFTRPAIPEQPAKG